MKRKVVLTEQQIINAIKKVVIEARRNPETNVDESFSQFYNRMLSKAPIENIFVSFRDSNHVTDVNPVNEYNTPTGYYSYPLSSFDIPENPSEVEFRRKFPFANHRKYISFFILKSHDGILTMETDRPTLNMYVERIKKLYPNSTKVEELCDSFIGETYSDSYKGKKPAHDTHLFWLFLYRITEGMDDGNKQNRINLICRKIGVNGFVDYEGKEFIHSSEPKQSVFFKVKNLGDVFTYEKHRLNKYTFKKAIQNKEYDIISKLTDGIVLISLFDKYGLINKNGELITKQVFDFIGDFYDGFAEVMLDDKYNFINKNGELISDQWFDFVSLFKGGFAKVELNDKWNLVNMNSELLFKQWFDWVGYFTNGLARVKLDDKWNLVNMNGEILFKQWLDYIDYLYDGFARVHNKEKMNFINQNGEVISKQWFDDVDRFNKGFVGVRLDGKGWNFMNQNGKILFPNQWFDKIDRITSPLVVKAEINGKEYEVNLIDRIITEIN